MSRITAIQPLSSDPSRLAVKVDRRTVAKLDAERVDRLGLAVGAEWTDDLAQRVRREADADRARTEALRILNRRMIGTDELRQRLLRKGCDRDSIERTLQSLTAAGLLDDEAYARAVIEQARSQRPAGPQLLRQKLFQRRLPRDLIDRAVDAAGQEADPVADARQLAERKLAQPSMQRADPATQTRRLWSLLARRGYSPDTIRQALDRIAGSLLEADDVD